MGQLPKFNTENEVLVMSLENISKKKIPSTSTLQFLINSLSLVCYIISVTFCTNIQYDMYKINLFSERQTFLLAKFMKNDEFSKEQVDWQRFVTVPSKKIVCPAYALNIRHLIVSRQGKTKWRNCRLIKIQTTNLVGSF